MMLLHNVGKEELRLLNLTGVSCRVEDKAIRNFYSNFLLAEKRRREPY